MLVLNPNNRNTLTWNTNNNNSNNVIVMRSKKPEWQVWQRIFFDYFSGIRSRNLRKTRRNRFSFVRLTLASSSSMNPWPRDLQKNLTVPSRTSSSILPDMEMVRVLRVTMTSGKRSPSGIGELTDGEREPRLGGVAAIVVTGSNPGWLLSQRELRESSARKNNKATKMESLQTGLSKTNGMGSLGSLVGDWRGGRRPGFDSKPWTSMSSSFKTENFWVQKYNGALSSRSSRIEST